MSNPADRERANHEQFVQQLTENQNRLYGYVYSLLGDHNRAADVVQETNMVLWRKIDEFEPEKPFLPWAFAIARFQVLAHIRDHKRDRFLLDAELVEKLSADIENASGLLESYREALRPCLKKLTPNNRELIEKRYFKSLPVAEVAKAADRTTGSIKVALLRIRRQLAECVQTRMATES